MHSLIQDIVFFCSYPNVDTDLPNNSIATASSDGLVTVWDTTLSLTAVHSFNVWSQLSQAPAILSDISLLPVAPPIVSKVVLGPTVPVLLGTPSLVKKEKWAKWVCSDVQVEQTDQGLYPGTMHDSHS